jgi:uncharacterized protein (TIGR03067 family)
MRTQLILALAAGLLVRPCHLKAGEKESEARELQGAWRMVSQQLAGRATARPKNMKWLIQGDTIWLIVERKGEGAPGKTEAARKTGPAAKREGQPGKGGKQSGPRGVRMTFRLRPGAPGRIDIDGPGKSLSFGVYKLAGDELTVCMGVTQASPSYDKQARGDEKTRPATISPEAGTVIVLKREKNEAGSKPGQGRGRGKAE